MTRTALELKVEKAYRAWRKAAERGYGDRHNTIAHLRMVDRRIGGLKAHYDALCEELKIERRNSRLTN